MQEGMGNRSPFDCLIFNRCESHFLFFFYSLSSWPQISSTSMSDAYESLLAEADEMDSIHDVVLQVR